MNNFMQINTGNKSNSIHLISNDVTREIITTRGYDVFNYISMYVDLDAENTKVLETSTRFNISSMKNSITNVVNLKKINDVRYINKFFETINQKLPYGGLFVGLGETITQRKKRILNRKSKLISIPHYILDFTLKRIFPKWGPTQKLYFILTKGRNRVLSKAEMLGRLISCGFDIIDEREINNELFFVAKKIKQPAYDKTPSYGFLIKMKRIGKDRKPIFVYKLRTMHPYSEYLQEYMYKKYNLKKGGKFKNDFRIADWGKVLRKLWLDEFPMFINWFKGDMKLFGVRPLSTHYFNLYTEELKELRCKTKPGLIPPFYVDLPTTLEGIMESEKKYLDAYFKNPLLTDIKYFSKAMYNIFVKKARSS